MTTGFDSFDGSAFEEFIESPLRARNLRPLEVLSMVFIDESEYSTLPPRIFAAEVAEYNSALVNLRSQHIRFLGLVNDYPTATAEELDAIMPPGSMAPRNVQIALRPARVIENLGVAQMILSLNRQFQWIEFWVDTSGSFRFDGLDDRIIDDIRRSIEALWGNTLPEFQWRLHGLTSERWVSWLTRTAEWVAP